MKILLILLISMMFAGCYANGYNTKAGDDYYAAEAYDEPQNSCGLL